MRFFEWLHEAENGVEFETHHGTCTASDLDAALHVGDGTLGTSKPP
jgi:hypothetical protein